jgi:hypothetical protein
MMNAKSLVIHNFAREEMITIEVRSRSIEILCFIFKNLLL